MKKYISRFLIVTLLAGGFFACDEGVPDEIFDKIVLLTRNGEQEIKIQYTESGVVEVPMTVSVNGTSGNDRDIKVSLGIDADTLKEYNYEKFRTVEALYYKILPTECYTYNREVVIPAGEEFGVFSVNLDLDKIDKFADFILPLAIEDVSEYHIAPSKHSKSLIQFILKNSFSGNYSVNGKVYDRNVNGDEGLSVTNRTFRVYDNTSCFFYAGHIDETDTERSKYMMRITIDPETLEVTLEGLNPDLQVHQDFCEVEIERRVDPSNLNQEIVTTTIELNYNFNGLSNPEDPDHYRFSGVLTMVEYLDLN